MTKTKRKKREINRRNIINKKNKLDTQKYIKTTKKTKPGRHSTQVRKW